MADVIKEFLVSLGFKVDGSSFKKFNEGIGAAAEGAAALGAAAAAAAIAVGAAVSKMASDFDQLYWQSQKLGSSANDIKGLSYAMSQLGSSAGDASAALGSIANFTFANGQGASNFLARLGVDPQHIGDAARTFKDLEVIFQRMVAQDPVNGQARANAYAGVLGISPDQLRAMLRDTGEYEKQYADFLAKIGLNADEAADKSNKFMTDMRLIKAEAGALFDDAALAVLEKILPALDRLALWVNNIGSGKKLTGIAGEFSKIWEAVQKLFGALGDLASTPYIQNFAEKMLSVLSHVISAFGSLAKIIADLLNHQWSAALSDAKSFGSDFAAIAGGMFKGVLGIGDDAYRGGSAGSGASAGNSGSPDAQPGIYGDTGPTGAAKRNNPGNLRNADGRGFRSFASATDGAIAMGRQLETYQKRDGLNTLAQIITRYAPRSENNTVAYIRQVANALGVSATASLNLGDQGFLAKLMHAMIGVEQGHQVFTPDQLRGLIAHNAAQIMRPYGGHGRGSVSLVQHNTFHAHGGDSREVVRGVHQQQGVANQRLFPNLATAAQ